MAAFRCELSHETVKRYRLWIKRLIKYCRAFSRDLDCESARSFIREYASPHTRRQGYYALKFLFVEVFGDSEFGDLVDFETFKKGRAGFPRKLWRWRFGIKPRSYK